MPIWDNQWSNLTTINNNNQFTNNDVPTADTFNKIVNNVGWLKNALYEYTVANNEALANIRSSINGINHILTFDDTPQPLSQNLVKSGGIYTFVNNRLNASYYKMVSRAGSVAEEQTINETGLYCVEFYDVSSANTIYCSATILIRSLNMDSATCANIIRNYRSGQQAYSYESRRVALLYNGTTKKLHVEYAQGSGEYATGTIYISKLYKIASMPTN